jgi:cell division protein FtsI/penicillin-binding protein 2
VFAPNLVREVRGQESGATIAQFGVRPVSTVPLPPEVRDPILQGLHGVAVNGTAAAAFHDPSSADFDLNAGPVAAKTGTAQVKDKADTALFAAVTGPAGQPPQYAMAVVLEQSGFGGANAAPVVAKVFDAIVEQRLTDPLTVDDYLRCVALSQAQAAEGKAADAAAAAPIVLPNGKVCA